jgi:hypothetical protein
MIEALVVIVIVLGVLYWHAAILGILGLIWFGFMSLYPVAWTIAHPWMALGVFAAYLLLGAVWSLCKWYLVERERVSEARARWAAADSNRSWAEYSAREKTRVTSYSGDIMAWIAFWPVNLLWTFIDDPIRRIYRQLQTAYQRITDSVWS